MSRYTMIADTSEALVMLFKEKLVPEMIANANHIGLCSPDDKGDYVVGIHLYNIAESVVMRYSGVRDVSYKLQQFPPMCLSLDYMITVYSDSDLKYRAADEQRLLGRILQIIHDHNTIQVYKNQDDPMVLHLLSLDTDEKLKIWNTTNMAYKTSLFLRIEPIVLESEKMREVSRVTTIDVTMEEK